jgi:hypothetical protein
MTPFDVLTADAVRERLKPLIDSGQYWTLVVPPEAYRIAEAIERRHYTGPANDDFHLVLAPRLGHTPVVAVLVAHKRHMGAKALRQILRQRGADPALVKAVGTRDMVILSTCEDPWEANALLGAFVQWVEGIHPERN